MGYTSINKVHLCRLCGGSRTYASYIISSAITTTCVRTLELHMMACMRNLVAQMSVYIRLPTSLSTLAPEK